MIRLLAWLYVRWRIFKAQDGPLWTLPFISIVLSDFWPVQVFSFAVACAVARWSFIHRAYAHMRITGTPVRFFLIANAAYLFRTSSAFFLLAALCALCPLMVIRSAGCWLLVAGVNYAFRQYSTDPFPDVIRKPHGMVKK